MMNKNAWKIVIFTTGVVMLLLRPFVVYEMTSRTVLPNNPTKAYNLLQRLVKKKDDHYEAPDKTFVETRRLRFSLQLPVKSLSHFYAGASATNAVLGLLAIAQLANTPFKISPENHRYRTLSCFQI